MAPSKLYMLMMMADDDVRWIIKVGTEGLFPNIAFSLGTLLHRLGTF